MCFALYQYGTLCFWVVLVLFVGIGCWIMLYLIRMVGFHSYPFLCICIITRLFFFLMRIYFYFHDSTCFSILLNACLYRLGIRLKVPASQWTVLRKPITACLYVMFVCSRCKHYIVIMTGARKWFESVIYLDRNCWIRVS